MLRVDRLVFAAALLFAAHVGCKDGGDPGVTSGGGAGTSQGGGGAGGSGGSGAALSTPAPGDYADGVPSASGGACPGGTSRCGESAFCCPDATACLADPNGLYCQAEYCCVGCPGGSVCGGGCCAAGTQCTANDGAPGCSGELCCAAKGDPECPGGVAAECPSGTSCVFNHSARACNGDFACYTPEGHIACPGEVACPNGIDFCPNGLHCQGLTGGVCQETSTSSNYCCKAFAGAGESCDTIECEPGTYCVPNNHCVGSDPSATNVCRLATCSPGFPVECGNYCCAADFPVCLGDCYCGQ